MPALPAALLHMYAPDNSIMQGKTPPQTDASSASAARTDSMTDEEYEIHIRAYINSDDESPPFPPPSTRQNSGGVCETFNFNTPPRYPSTSLNLLVVQLNSQEELDNNTSDSDASSDCTEFFVGSMSFLMFS